MTADKHATAPVPPYDVWHTEPEPAKGFDVTAVIGRVTFGDGDVSPIVAAFALIGKHSENGATGTYYFPAEDGGTHVVDVDYKP